MKLSALLITLIVFCVHVCGGEDLYKVLGVRKTASNAEIKKAYKKLAKEWHPDRNRAPEANDKFMKINEAYTTLSDTEKRQHYDNYGTTSAQSDGGPHHGGNPFGAHPFEEFFQQGPFGFQFNFGGGGRRESPFSKFRITLRAYQNNILAESREKPYLIYAYSDFCYHCMEVEMIWDKIVQDATVLGMGIGTVQVQLDHALAGRLRVSSIPALVGIVGGKLRYFGNRYSVNNIREFSRSLLPTDLVTRVTDKNYGEFLNGWRDNRVRALFFGEKSEPTMRYLMAAFQYRENVAAGYVDLSRDDIDEVEGLFRINNGMETLLMFGEAMHNPVATLAMKKLPRSTIDQTMESNKFLALPRLSSQAIFNQLCPPSSQPKRKKLCVVLLTRNNPDYDDSRGTFRKYAQDHVSADERVRYAYIYEDTQAQWVQKLTKGEGIVNETNLKVAVLWRRDTDRLYFDWLEEGWPLNGDDGDLRRSRRKLHQLVDWFIEGSQLMPFTMDKPPELTDENAEHILRRIALKLSDWYEIIVDRLYNMDVVSLMTMFMTVGFVLVIGYMMTTLAGIEEERINSRNTRRPQRPQSRAQATMNTRPSVDAAQRPTLYMHQLHEETFESLVIKSEPGVRLIVMLVDKASKDKLLQTFASIVLPYSRSEAFTFCFLQLEHNLGWLRHLLEETLDFKRDLNNINIKNCIGTVLAINGPRKYYCIYHAQEERVRRQLKAQGYSLGGGFMGFEDSSDEEDSDNASNLDAQKLFESDLMNGLGTWMDRLCEGSLRRFRVEYWPPMST